MYSICPVFSTMEPPVHKRGSSKPNGFVSWKCEVTRHIGPKTIQNLKPSRNSVIIYKIYVYFFNDLCCSLFLVFLSQLWKENGLSCSPSKNLGYSNQKPARSNTSYTKALLGQLVLKRPVFHIRKGSS